MPRVFRGKPSKKPEQLQKKKSKVFDEEESVSLGRRRKRRRSELEDSKPSVFDCGKSPEKEAPPKKKFRPASFSDPFLDFDGPNKKNKAAVAAISPNSFALPPPDESLFSPKPQTDRPPPKHKAKRQKLVSRPPHEIPGTWQASSVEIVEHFLKQNKFIDFWAPVKWQEWDLLDYPEIVKKPMDFTTIKEKLCKNEYNSVSGFREDAKLVWNNAFAYNSPGSEIYKISFVLRDKFFETCQEKKLSVIGKEEDQSWIERSKTVMEQLSNEEEASIFCAPVDWKGQNLYDYPKKIPNPMDLGTVKEKLDKKLYSSFYHMSEDVLLVWKNASKYNGKDSSITHLAQNVNIIFQTLIEENNLEWTEWKTKCKRILEKIMCEKNCEHFCITESKQWKIPKKEPSRKVISKEFHTPSLTNLYNLFMSHEIKNVENLVKMVFRIFENALAYYAEHNVTINSNAKHCLAYFKRCLTNEGITYEKPTKTPIVNRNNVKNNGPRYGTRKKKKKVVVNVVDEDEEEEKGEKKGKKKEKLKKVKSIEGDDYVEAYEPNDNEEVYTPSTRRRKSPLERHLSTAIANLMKHRKSHPFNQPVKEEYAPGYFSIIERPMDFGTIKSKLSKYTCFEEFDGDVRLVFTNAAYYNTEGPVLDMSQALIKYYEQTIYPRLEEALSESLDTVFME